MYSQFLDHIAVAFGAYQKKDAVRANAALKAAFESPDAKRSLSALISVNAKNFSAEALTASDVGVQFEQPGDDLRVLPEQNTPEPTPIVKIDDQEEDEPILKIELGDEDLLHPAERLSASARIAASRSPSQVKASYFASLKG